MNTETKRHADKPAYNRRSKYREDPLEALELEGEGLEDEADLTGLEDLEVEGHAPGDTAGMAEAETSEEQNSSRSSQRRRTGRR